MLKRNQRSPLEREEGAGSGAIEEGATFHRAAETVASVRGEETRTMYVGTVAESGRQTTNRNAQLREFSANTAKEQATTVTCANR